MEDHDALADVESRDALPDGAMVPAISWPKMRGAEWEPVWIFFRSVPQMPQVATLISTSPGPIVGRAQFRRACR